jgi:hypothetical protein
VCCVYDAERALGGRDREEEEVDEEECEDDRGGSIAPGLACLTRISRTSSSSSSSDVEDDTGEVFCGGGEDRGCEGALRG